MRIFVIEGADGTGKSTLAKNLVALTTERQPGVEASYYRLPSDDLGIRSIFMDKDPSNETLSLLAMADMVNAYQKFIEQSQELARINKGLVVFLDREIISTMVYQGYYSGRPTLALETWRTFVKWCPANASGLILLKSHKAAPAADKEENHFDDYDQDKLTRIYDDLPYLYWPGASENRANAQLEQLRDNVSGSVRDAFKAHYTDMNSFYSMDTGPDELAETVYSTIF